MVSNKRWAGILWDEVYVSNLRVPGCRTAVLVPYIEGITLRFYKYTMEVRFRTQYHDSNVLIIEIVGV